MPESAAAPERLRAVPELPDDLEPAEERDRSERVTFSMTPDQRGRIIEMPDYVSFVRRILKACSRRAAEGDVESLRALMTVREELDQTILRAVEGLHAQGYSWADIADGLGTTRQYAHRKYGKLGSEDEEPG